jgi:hypothetical protein
MTVAVVLAAVLVASGCSKKTDAPVPEPVGSAAPIPEATTIDWANLVYDVGSLGTVKATNGRAEFRVSEDDDGTLHATQAPAAKADETGFLDLDEPTYVDLDHDDHDEIVIPFELASSRQADPPHVFGAFVFTLRNGDLVKLGTITTTTKPGFTVSGSSITTTDGRVWGWDGSGPALVERLHNER